MMTKLPAPSEASFGDRLAVGEQRDLSAGCAVARDDRVARRFDPHRIELRHGRREVGRGRRHGPSGGHRRLGFSGLLAASAWRERQPAERGFVGSIGRERNRLRRRHACAIFVPNEASADGDHGGTEPKATICGGLIGAFLLADLLIRRFFLSFI